MKIAIDVMGGDNAPDAVVEGCAMALSKLGQDASRLQTIFKATRDIRSKYILSQLAWDMGVLDEIKV